MAGRPPWSQPGTHGGGQTVAVNDRPELVEHTANQTDTVAAGGTEVVEIYAPTDAIWTVNSLYFKAAADGDWTTGTHNWKWQPLDSVPVILRGGSDYTTDITWQGSNFRSAQTQEPSQEVSQNIVLGRMKATAQNPLVSEYDNSADKVQEMDRNISMVLEEVTY